MSDIKTYDIDKMTIITERALATLKAENERLRAVIKKGADKINGIPDFMTDPETIPDEIANAVISKCYAIENKLRQALKDTE